MDENPNVGGKSPLEVTRPPDLSSSPIPNSFSPPDASTLPRKRPREELPNPICGESDLTRPSPASTEESSKRKSRAKNNKLNQPSTRDGPTGSRFDILADSDVIAEPEGTPHVDGVTMGGKQFDTVTTSLASNLAAALAQAPCMQDDSTVKTGKSKTQLSARKPLTEVSNDAPKIPKPTRVTVEGELDGENTPSLVNVPILYDNPTFQGIQRGSNNVKAKKQTPKRDKGLARTFFLREISWGLVGVALVQKGGFPFRWTE
ncbi:hypothetical protein LINPERPRIM_LOCUS38240 [Linum perenne]